MAADQISTPFGLCYSTEGRDVKFKFGTPVNPRYLEYFKDLELRFTDHSEVIEISMRDIENAFSPYVDMWSGDEMQSSLHRFHFHCESKGLLCYRIDSTPYIAVRLKYDQEPIKRAEEITVFVNYI